MDDFRADYCLAVCVGRNIYPSCATVIMSHSPHGFTVIRQRSNAFVYFNILYAVLFEKRFYSLYVLFEKRFVCFSDFTIKCADIFFCRCVCIRTSAFCVNIMDIVYSTSDIAVSLDNVFCCLLYVPAFVSATDILCGF